MSSGAVVWAGVESIGQHDGRFRLVLAEDASQLLSLPEDADRWSEHPTHTAILEYLSSRGASFFAQIQSAIRGFKNETLEALWELVWSGFVTNDTLQPVRSIIKPALSDSRAAGRRAALAARTRGMARSHAPATPPEAAGRWSLVSDMISMHQPTHSERVRAQCLQLLNRYGVLTRESVQAEGAAIAGGFSTLYPVLKLMEESGSIRRGYFVKDLGPTQFALPGAVDRLRLLRQPDEEASIAFIGATDPANPFGAVLPWPERSAGRKPMRLVGSWVVIIDGCLAAWLAPGDSQLVTFLENVPYRSPEAAAQQVAETLAREVMHARRKAVFLTEIDGSPVPAEPMASALEHAGFHKSEQGYQRRL
jgi:ATP-dependent Lhr-like helicase